MDETIILTKCGRRQPVLFSNFIFRFRTLTTNLQCAESIRADLASEVPFDFTTRERKFVDLFRTSLVNAALKISDPKSISSYRNLSPTGTENT